jgi:hypothetical protein
MTVLCTTCPCAFTGFHTDCQSTAQLVLAVGGHNPTGVGQMQESMYTCDEMGVLHLRNNLGNEGLAADLARLSWQCTIA